MSSCLVKKPHAVKKKCFVQFSPVFAFSNLGGGSYPVVGCVLSVGLVCVLSVESVCVWRVGLKCVRRVGYAGLDRDLNSGNIFMWRRSSSIQEPCISPESSKSSPDLSL